MRILLVTSFFPPAHTAGTEMRTLAYAKRLHKLGYEVQVICAEDWDKGNKYWTGYSDDIYQGIPVRRIHLNWMLAPDPNRFLYSSPVVEEYLGNFLTEWKPDVTHITSCVGLSASVIQAAKDHNVPVVLTLTDFWFICPRLNLLRSDSSLCNGQTTPLECLKCTMRPTKISRLLNSVLPEESADKTLIHLSQTPFFSRLPGLRGMAFDMEHRKAYLAHMLQAADYVTAPSETVRETVNQCVDHGVDTMIPSGHDLSWLEGLRPREQAGPLRIAYIGQIIPIKGVHTLLLAYLSAGLTTEAELVIYGDPSKSPEYFNRLQELSSSQKAAVQFKGAFSHHQLGEVLSEIDLLVVPSLWHENNPRVIQEGFAAKIPVIASNVGGISEFVQPESNGLLFERGNVEDLSKQLQRIVQEPDLLEKLRAGIKPVKSIEEEISEFIRIYSMLISGKLSTAV
jgi:glycosyltransferase involved in cell wall biosynthesis